MARKPPNQIDVRRMLNPYIYKKDIAIIDVSDIFKEWSDVRQRLDIAVRASLQSYERKGYIVELTEKTYNEDGYYIKVVERAVLLAKPTECFIRLKNYLLRFSGKNIGIRDIVKMQLVGNGSSYTEQNHRYLAYDDKACTALLLWLRSNKTQSASIYLWFDSSIDYGNKGTDSEKWIGNRDCFARIEIRNKRGLCASTSTSSFFI